MGAVIPAVASVVGLVSANKQAKVQNQAVQQAADTSADASNFAAALQANMFNRQIELQEPWRQSGINALNRMNSGEFSVPQAFSFTPNKEYAIPDAFSFDPSKVSMDPGYQFRFNEGMNALNRSAAARGGLISGAAMKAATRYGQDMGSQEFGNAYNRAYDRALTEYNSQVNRSQMGYNRDYDRALTQYNSEVNRSQLGYNRLAGLSGTAQASVGEIGRSGQAYATNAGNIAINNAANQGNALLAAANNRGSQYAGYGTALNQLGNVDWGKAASTIGGWFGR